MGEIYITFWLENLKERDHLEVQGIDDRILKWLLKKWGGRVWTGFIWLMIGNSGGLL
jgi:hypothetical protein